MRGLKTLLNHKSKSIAIIKSDLRKKKLLTKAIKKSKLPKWKLERLTTKQLTSLC